MSYDTTIAETVHPESPSALPRAIAAREIHLERVMPAIRKETLLLGMLLAVVFLAVSFFPLHHTDLWGHMALGRWAADATTASPLPVDDKIESINTAWLSQAVLFRWFTATGIQGLQFAHALLAAVSAGLLVFATRRRGVSLAVAIGAAAAAFVLTLPVIGVLRPQLFGLVAIPLVLAGVAALDTGKKHPLCWLPLVMLAWANLHGSFVVGLAVIGCLAVARTIDTRRDCVTWRQTFAINRAGSAWLALVLATVACCIHPAGPALLWQTIAFGSSVNLSGISEWQPLTLKSLSGALFFTTLLFTAALLRRSSRTIRIYEVLLLVGLAVGTLLAIRMLVWWAIIWPWVVAPHVEAIFASRRSEHDDTSVTTPVYTLMATVVVMLTLIWSPPTYALITGQPSAETQILTTDTPVFLAKEIQQRNLAGRALVPMEWADYLAFQSGGDLKPVVHSHVHLIKPGLMRDYRRVMAGHADWLDILDHHEVRYLVVRDLYEFSIADQVINHPRIRMLYRDQQGVIFAVSPEKDVKQIEQPAAAAAETVQSTEQGDHRPSNTTGTQDTP